MVIYMYYLNTFFIYSILGFLLETLISFITRSHFSSGILYGPWTPIYGIGVIIIILLSNYLFLNLHMHRFYETIIVFIIVTIVLTLIEWLGGTIIESIFHITFWDYSSHKYNIGKYVSLGMSLVWGIASIIFIYIIRPIVDKFIYKIPVLVSILLTVLFIIDGIITFYIRTKK